MEKLSGPEMLLKNLLGISPTEMKATIQSMISKVEEIHTFMNEIRGRLDRLEKHLGVSHAQDIVPLLENEAGKEGQFRGVVNE